MKTIVNSPNAPAAIGPYSQATKANGFVFISGQLPLNPATGKMEEGDVAAKATRSLENLKAILEEAGSSFANVLKVTVFLTDMQDFAAVNEVYKKYFPSECPARSCFAVAALPLGAPVEIEVIALCK